MEKEKNGSVVSERSRITSRDARDDERRNSRRESREDYEREDLTRKGTKNSRDFKAKSKSKSRRRYNSDSSSESESESTVSERSRKVTVNNARDDDDRRNSKRKSRESSEPKLDERGDLDRNGEKSVKDKRGSKSREDSELEVDEREELVKNTRDSKSKSKSRPKSKSRRRYDSDSSISEAESSYSDDSDSRSDASESDTESEEERRRRRKKRKRREEEKERERRRRREKDKKKKRKEKDEKKKKKKKDHGSKGAVTNSWGKYGIIREQDMWNKRPEFTAWLMEVKQVNLEHLPNWEEKQMFKQFMEDHNTATFPSKKYYNLDAFYRRQLEKEVKKGSKKVEVKEMTVFNDEEQRRLELMKEREKRKEEEVETLKRSMQSGMAQAMKEQAQLREEMALLYKLGHSEAAAAIQRRLDPDVPM